jgi:DNA-binding PadR family transcriptional regulator
VGDFDDVFEYFEHPAHNLNRQEAIAYIAWCLLNLPEDECYPTNFIETLRDRCPGMDLSDTILLCALTRLEDGHLVTFQRVRLAKQGRGRPRKVYKTDPDHREILKQLSDLWTATHLTAELRRA